MLAGARWLFRKRSRLRSRQVFLLDSRVVLGAAKKGRSSSPALSYSMKRLSALLLFTGTLAPCLYIPTEYNPADFPSRGLRIPGRRRPPPKATPCPLCKVLPENHPLHVPKWLRGMGTACRPRHGYGFAYRDGRWISEACIQHAELDAALINDHGISLEEFLDGVLDESRASTIDQDHYA